VTTEADVSALPGITDWICRREIESIPGALKPGAYVARAYKYTQQNNGAFPAWARKLGNDQWLFNGDYIRADAKRNTETMSVHEAALMLGATRRAIQIWVDQGDIQVETGGRGKGEERRIVRDAFVRELSRLRKRLETPSVVIRKVKHGGEVAGDVVERVRAEMKQRHDSARGHDRVRKHEFPVVEIEPQQPVTEETCPVKQAPQPVAQQAAATEGKTAKERAALALEQRLKRAVAGRATTKVAAETTSPLSGETRFAEIKRNVAARIEARLKAALAGAAPARSPGEQARLEERAISLAEDIQVRMFDEDFAVRKAELMFMQEAANEGIPLDVRIKICKRIFTT
jgi:hypothetical protein